MKRTVCLLIFAGILVVSLPSVSAESASSNTNCTAYSHVLTGVQAYMVYTNKFYNAKSDMEQPGSQYFVATNIFKPGLQLAAVAGLFAPTLMYLQDDPLATNYPGFAGMNFPGLYGNMLFKILSQTCDWLMSYPNYALTLRYNVNCSEPAEMIMFAQWALVEPIVEDINRNFGPVMGTVGCSSYDYNTWVQNNVYPQFQPEIDYLIDLVDNHEYQGTGEKHWRKRQ